MNGHPYDDVVEQRIREALEAGAFRNLPGEGKPLEIEDTSGVSDELRAGYIVLKNANVLPEELELKQSLLRIGDLIEACDDEGEVAELKRERDAAALKLSILMEKRGVSAAWLEYQSRIAAKLRSSSEESRP